MRTVGVISDTHGLLRPEAEAALADAAHIIHAGDIGAPAILERLRRIAPVTAVRGNNDADPWAQPLPQAAVANIDGRRLYVLHNIAELDFDPAAEGLSAVITGHSHKPVIAHRDGVLFLNPGSAGPRRFKLPIAVAKIYVDSDRLHAEIIELAVRPGTPAQ